ncbi:hypothetical protein HID58_015834 [Brassica napus]|uniref:Uncharacterized protein n=1 Tax=Brassica napus TaxID=3708 RepID=A0ABQ8DL79_BRANA|nr:hypothetical protein HID58_015834 [Brassica napus]
MLNWSVLQQKTNNNFISSSGSHRSSQQSHHRFERKRLFNFSPRGKKDNGSGGCSPVRRVNHLPCLES